MMAKSKKIKKKGCQYYKDLKKNLRRQAKVGCIPDAGKLDMQIA